jgi:3-isopropylmalate dehydrogenase
MMVDTFAMRLAMQPQRFDVVVTTNMFGDILSDEAAGLVGGLGLAPGLCAGTRWAMAQATHGSAPDIAGRGVANPYAMIVSGQMLFAWLGRKHDNPRATQAADRMARALDRVMQQQAVLTPDLGGQGTTTTMTDQIVKAI